MTTNFGASTNRVDQRNTAPGGDAVGRDKITNIHPSLRRTQIDGWLEKLAEQRRDDVEMRDLVENLQYFFESYAYDEVVGLEAKLDHAGRSNQKRLAIRKKEAFSKLLTDWQAFPAAQEIIAYFLGMIEQAFEIHIIPMLSCASPEEIDQAIAKQLVGPVLEEMGAGPFMLNHVNVYGMVYWLAERCYIRWHT